LKRYIAHYGYFTIYAGNIISPNGLIISIEPHEKCYQGILKNVQINGLQKIVRRYNVGLSDHQGKAQMDILNERAFYDTENGEIDVVSFDQLCEKENIRPDIIKIDVHGAEGKVIKGMSNKLKNDVTHLFCETHSDGDMRGYSMIDIIQFLETAGMEVFVLSEFRKESGGKLIRINDKVLSTPGDSMLYARRK